MRKIIGETYKQYGEALQKEHPALFSRWNEQLKDYFKEPPRMAI